MFELFANESKNSFSAVELENILSRGRESRVNTLPNAAATTHRGQIFQRSQKFASLVSFYRNVKSKC
jgi:hypothetical protein